MKILNLEPEQYSPVANDVLSSLGTVTNGLMSREDLIGSISAYDVVIVRLGHKIDREVIDAGTALKVIATPTTGLNHIDVDYATKKNIAVLSLKGETEFLSGIYATAEHTMALMLSLARHIPHAHNSVLDCIWNRDLFKGIELEGKTIGIIGLGRLGKKVSGYAHAFGMNVISYDTNPSCSAQNVVNVDLDTLLKTSDVVSIHIPSMPENLHFINDVCFEKMKEGVFFINTSRGDVICQSSLLKALQNKKIGAAALDVLEEEYDGVIEQSPLLEYARNNQNLILTPHIGGATYESMYKTEVFIAQKICDWVKTR